MEIRLNGYKIMWVIVMFDLPTETTQQKKAYREFRNNLLDMGFTMSQYSIYMRFAASREVANSYADKIKKFAPAVGKISILFITDKQFGNIINIIGTESYPRITNPEQYSFF